MQRFDIRETQEVTARGRYLRWDTDSGQSIRVRAAGVDLGELFPGELLELPEPVDKWLITPAAGETGFVRVGLNRVDSDRKNPQSRVPILLMETDVGAVPGGGAPGWVSGTLAGLAASGNATIVFDLGSEWRQYSILEVTVSVSSPSTGLNPVQFWGGDTPAPISGRRRGSPFATGMTTYFSNITSTAGPQTYCMRPAGRYLIVTATNADATNACGASSKVTLGAYPA